MSQNYYNFAALSGIQGRKGNYLIQVPLSVLSRFLSQENSSLPIEQRSQRILNKTRVNQIANYIVSNPDSYILPPLVAHIKYGEVKFDRFEGSVNLGTLIISMDAQIQLFDGQHRLAGIEEALKLGTFVRDETIGVMIYSCGSIKSAQQVFADINIHATKPSQSIKLLYNHRDGFTSITRKTIDSVPMLSKLIDFERTNLSPKSDKLFTFSGIYQATKLMLNGLGDHPDPDTLVNFWQKICENIDQWKDAESGGLLPSELRENYIHGHSVVWVALAILGLNLIKQYPENWHVYIEKLNSINWSRDCAEWEGRCISNGRIQKSKTNILLTANLIMLKVGLVLPSDHIEIEENFIG